MGRVIFFYYVTRNQIAAYEEHKIDEIYEYLTAHELLELPQARLAASKSVESKLTAKAAPSNPYELIEEITEQCLHRHCSVIFIICLHIR